jgi:hypothetical protein
MVKIVLVLAPIFVAPSGFRPCFRRIPDPNPLFDEIVLNPVFDWNSAAWSREPFFTMRCSLLKQT